MKNIEASSDHNFNFEMMYFQLLLLCLPLVALGSQLGSLQYDHLSKEVENLDAPPLHGKIFTQLGSFFNVHPLHGELYFFSKKLIFSLLFPTTPSPFCQSVYHFLPSVSNHAIPILSICLSVAANLGDYKLMKKLLLNPNVDPNHVDDFRTPLLRACFEGHDETVEVLLKHPKIIVSGTDEMGYNALHTAAWKGHNLVVKMLLKDGRINPKDMTLNRYNQAGATALHLAANNGKNGAMRALIKDGRSDVSQLWNGKSLILLASAGGHAKVVQTLMDIGVDINIRDKSGTTPLYAAAEHGHAAVIKVLVQDSKLNRKWGPYEGGVSPLTIASWGRHEEVRDVLLGKKQKKVVLPKYTMMDAFKLTDQNEDNMITAEEVNVVSTRISKHTGKEVLEKYDLDHSKSLNKNELAQYLLHQCERTDVEPKDFLLEFIGRECDLLFFVLFCSLFLFPSCTV